MEHLQSELSQQYLLYREERDARKLLIRQLNDLTGRSAMGEQTEEENMGRSGSISELALSQQLNDNCICNEPSIQVVIVKKKKEREF